MPILKAASAGGGSPHTPQVDLVVPEAITPGVDSFSVIFNHRSFQNPKLESLPHFGEPALASTLRPVPGGVALGRRGVRFGGVRLGCLEGTGFTLASRRGSTKISILGGLAIWTSQVRTVHWGP